MRKRSYILDLEIDDEIRFAECIYIFTRGKKADRINPPEYSEIELLDIRVDGESVIHKFDRNQFNCIEDHILDLEERGVI
jgi:hypothetical protein